MRGVQLGTTYANIPAPRAGLLAAGDAVQVLSQSDGKWHDGEVEMVAKENCRMDGRSVPAGSVKVVYMVGTPNARGKWIGPDDVARQVRRNLAQAAQPLNQKRIVADQNRMVVRLGGKEVQKGEPIQVFSESDARWHDGEVEFVAQQSCKMDGRGIPRGYIKVAYDVGTPTARGKWLSPDEFNRKVRTPPTAIGCAITVEPTRAPTTAEKSKSVKTPTEEKTANKTSSPPEDTAPPERLRNAFDLNKTTPAPVSTTTSAKTSRVLEKTVLPQTSTVSTTTPRACNNDRGGKIPSSKLNMQKTGDGGKISSSPLSLEKGVAGGKISSSPVTVSASKTLSVEAVDQRPSEAVDEAASKIVDEAPFFFSAVAAADKPVEVQAGASVVLQSRPSVVVSSKPLALVEEVTVTFQPGSLGMGADWDCGLVDHSKPNGQAANAGINAGMRCVKINGEPYSERLLDKMIAGDKPYSCTFQKQASANTAANTALKEDAQDGSFKIGAPVEVFSNTYGGWQKGVVLEVTDEKENGIAMVNVRFEAPDGKTMEKLMPTNHSDVRIP
jgi:hypothetical protein